MSSAQFQLLHTTTVTVAAAGTSVQVNGGNSLWVRSALLQGAHANSGNVYFGSSAAGAHAAAGYSLPPNSSVGIGGDMLNGRDVQFDLSTLWVDADANGAVLILTYFTEALHQ